MLTTGHLSARASPKAGGKVGQTSREGYSEISAVIGAIDGSMF